MKLRERNNSRNNKYERNNRKSHNLIKIPKIYFFNYNLYQ